MIRKKTCERKKIVTLPPSYIQIPDLIHTIPLVIIHKGVEVIIVKIDPPISVANVRLGKRIDWAVIDHMPQGVASSTDSKVADIIRVSPSKAEITLGCQTMLCHMTWCGVK